MKKIISILACVCLLLSVIVIPASAAEISATISFATTDGVRTEYVATSHQKWEQNGITVTNNKGSSTSNIGDYCAPARFYKGSDVIIEYPSMTKIEIDVAGITSKNQVAWVDSCTSGTASMANGIVTIVLDEPADSYSIKLTANQARANSITVYAEEPAEEEVFVGLDPEDPIQLAVSEGAPVIPVEIRVPAEGTVFVNAADANGTLYVTSASGSYMLINGRQNQLSADGEAEFVLCGYEVINVYNPSETDTLSLYVFLVPGAEPEVGTWENPEVLELQTNPYMPNFPPVAETQTVLAEGNQGHFYKIVATEDGAFAINISANDDDWNSVGYQFNVTNSTTSWQSDFVARGVDADDYYDTMMVAVNAGDEIIINAATFDPSNVWVAPAGNLNVRINFAKVGSYEYPVVLEETGSYTANIDADSQGYYYEWVATENGKVTITINDEAGWQYTVSKVPVDEDDYSSYYNSDTYYFDDEVVVSTEIVSVKAGETIKVWINTYDPENPWSAPAGSIDWTISFAKVAFGNVDGDADGSIDGKDAAKLMQYLNNYKGVEIDVDAADVNGDGKLNGRDYALLLQYLNGWDVELG